MFSPSSLPLTAPPLSPDHIAHSQPPQIKELLQRAEQEARTRRAPHALPPLPLCLPPLNAAQTGRVLSEALSYVGQDGRTDGLPFFF